MSVTCNSLYVIVVCDLAQFAYYCLHVLDMLLAHCGWPSITPYHIYTHNHLHFSSGMSTHINQQALQNSPSKNRLNYKGAKHKLFGSLDKIGVYVNYQYFIWFVDPCTSSYLSLIQGYLSKGSNYNKYIYTSFDLNYRTNFTNHHIT